MPYRVNKFQDVPSFTGEEPSIVVTDSDPNWDECYKRWLSGLNPTDSKLWDKGVYGCEMLRV